MKDTFVWPLEFNKPVAVNEEIIGHGILVLQSAAICEGSSKASIFATVNGHKILVAVLDPIKRVSSKLNLMVSAATGEFQLSVNQGAKVVVMGTIEADSCCDHDHEHDEECEEDCEDMEQDSEMESEVDDSEEESDEEEPIASTPVTPANKKVSFNPKEQGPHKPAEVATPLKPVLKQQPEKPQQKVQQSLAEKPQKAVAEKPQQQQKSQQAAETPQTPQVGATVTLPGGLKYTLLREGRGPVAAPGRQCQVKYNGCLASNGKRFDKGTIWFKLGAGQVIQGWDRGVKDMRVGESRRLLIPAALGYGSKGAPPAIPPNAALAFEVELVNMK